MSIEMNVETDLFNEEEDPCEDILVEMFNNINLKVIQNIIEKESGEIDVIISGATPITKARLKIGKVHKKIKNNNRCFSFQGKMETDLEDCLFQINIEVDFKAKTLEKENEKLLEKVFFNMHLGEIENIFKKRGKIKGLKILEGFQKKLDRIRHITVKGKIREDQFEVISNIEFKFDVSHIY